MHVKVIWEKRENCIVKRKYRVACYAIPGNKLSLIIVGIKMSSGIRKLHQVSSVHQMSCMHIYITFNYLKIIQIYNSILYNHLLLSEPSHVWEAWSSSSRSSRHTSQSTTIFIISLE